ncbi:MAG TPA: TRAM domain-containing protein [Candidatus Polarisedimenticolaceae bacterium]
MQGWIVRGVLIFAIAVAALASRPLAPLGPRLTGELPNLLFGLLVGLTAVLGEGIVRRGNPRAIGAGAMGAIVGGLAFSMTLRAIPLMPPARPFAYAIAIWVGAACGAAWARSRSLAPAAASVVQPPEREEGSLLLDTSAIIDGRIVDLAKSGIAPGPWIVPSFVLRELQQVADSEDPARRARGRRGLEALERLRAIPGLALRILESDPADTTPVDDRLIAAAGRTGAALVTTDFNLVKVASLHGARVVNVHEIAQSMRGAAAPGETLSLLIVREGKEPGQGVGYLDDGTMIVVVDAADRVGSEVEVAITGATQTASGRMLFAKVKGQA